MSVILLGCSTITPPVNRQSAADYAAETRLSRKSRATPIEIPIKGRIPNDRGLAIEIAQLDLSADSALTLYRHPATRNAVIDFFIQLAGTEEVALTVLYYSDKFQINPFLSFSLVYTESRYSPVAKGLNRSSVDRGLFQLNSNSFPNLQDHDFYNIDTNARHGINHLKWCLDRAKSNEDTALAIYNAGLGRVSSGDIPASTQAYVRKIKSYKDSIAARFKVFISKKFSQETGDKG